MAYQLQVDQICHRHVCIDCLVGLAWLPTRGLHHGIMTVCCSWGTRHVVCCRRCSATSPARLSALSRSRKGFCVPARTPASSVCSATMDLSILSMASNSASYSSSSSVARATSNDAWVVDRPLRIASGTPNVALAVETLLHAEQLVDLLGRWIVVHVARDRTCPRTIVYSACNKHAPQAEATQMRSGVGTRAFQQLQLCSYSCQRPRRTVPTGVNTAHGLQCPWRHK